MLVSLVKVRDHNYQFITAKPFAPNLGAEIYGVDLSKPISEAQFADIFQEFLDFCFSCFFYVFEGFSNFRHHFQIPLKKIVS